MTENRFAMHYLTTVSEVTYPDGRVGSCYALCSYGSTGNRTAACVTIKRATELETEGVPYVTEPGVSITPSAFDTFYAPDFPMAGEPRREARGCGYCTHCGYGGEPSAECLHKR